jgi:pimeloyl-ACP methyl ester carboxylesterase
MIPAAAVPTPARVTRTSVEFARTPDGWDLALHYYRGVPVGRVLPPLILCPGYSCNRVFMDFDDRYSLARFLARCGFDAWVVEPRGHGYSEFAGEHPTDWTFDDLVELDVPTAVHAVRAQSGRRPVWIGHSMGGILMYAALGGDAALQDSVTGLVTMASPVAFPPLTSPLLRGVGQLLATLPLPQRLPQRGALVALWSAISWAPGTLDVGMNPANVDRRAFGDALRSGLCNVPRSLLRQLADWSLSGELRSCDQQIDYRAALSRITTPALIIAGAVDRLAPPEIVRFAYDHISSPCKQYREFSIRNGDSADYGHVDLVFGRRAPEEVFPAIAAWIASLPEGE